MTFQKNKILTISGFVNTLGYFPQKWYQWYNVEIWILTDRNNVNIQSSERTFFRQIKEKEEGTDNS